MKHIRFALLLRGSNSPEYYNSAASMIRDRRLIRRSQCSFICLFNSMSWVTMRRYAYTLDITSIIVILLETCVLKMSSLCFLWNIS